MSVLSQKLRTGKASHMGTSDGSLSDDVEYGKYDRRWFSRPLVKAFSEYSKSSVYTRLEDFVIQ